MTKEVFSRISFKKGIKAVDKKGKAHLVLSVYFDDCSVEVEQEEDSIYLKYIRCKDIDYFIY